MIPMSKLISRRESLKILAAGGLITVLPPATEIPTEENPLPWRNTNDRVWLGGEFWANPMEDWRDRKTAGRSALTMREIAVFII